MNHDSLHNLVSDTLLFIKDIKEQNHLEKLPVKPSPSTKKADQESILGTLSTVAPHLKLMEKPSTVYVVAFPDDAPYLAFLEAISNAIDKQLAPCQIVHCKNEKEFATLLQTPFLQLVLASFKEKKSHAIEGKVLPLAQLENYTRDNQLKRALWNLLKSHFSPQSSSTLRSIKP